MKSNLVFLRTVLLTAPLALSLQGNAQAQTDDTTNTPPPPRASQGEPRPVGAPFYDTVDFYFPGGTPGQFVSAVEKQYKVDWVKVANIPADMQDIHIPALRMNRQSSDQILGFGFGGGGIGRSSFSTSLGAAVRGGGGGASDGGGGIGGVGGGVGGAVGGAAFSPAGGQGWSSIEHSPLRALIALYNSLEQAKPEMGQLLVEGDLTKPSVVIFHSKEIPAALPERKVKAFSLQGIPEWDKLEAEINKQFDVELNEQTYMAVHFRGPKPMAGASVTVHSDTGLLIVAGPEWAVEAAESFVTAWRANHPPPASR